MQWGTSSQTSWNSYSHSCPPADSPWGTMPFLEVDGKTIGGSTVIARYLGEKFGMLCLEHIITGNDSSISSDTSARTA